MKLVFGRFVYVLLLTAILAYTKIGLSLPPEFVQSQLTTKEISNCFLHNLENYDLNAETTNEDLTSDEAISDITKLKDIPNHCSLIETNDFSEANCPTFLEQVKIHIDPINKSNQNNNQLENFEALTGILNIRQNLINKYAALESKECKNAIQSTAESLRVIYNNIVYNYLWHQYGEPQNINIKTRHQQLHRATTSFKEITEDGRLVEKSKHLFPSTIFENPLHTLTNDDLLLESGDLVISKNYNIYDQIRAINPISLESYTDVGIIFIDKVSLDKYKKNKSTDLTNFDIKKFALVISQSINKSLRLESFYNFEKNKVFIEIYKPVNDDLNPLLSAAKSYSKVTSNENLEEHLFSFAFKDLFTNQLTDAIQKNEKNENYINLTEISKKIKYNSNFKVIAEWTDYSQVEYNTNITSAFQNYFSDKNSDKRQNTALSKSTSNSIKYYQPKNQRAQPELLETIRHINAYTLLIEQEDKTYRTQQNTYGLNYRQRLNLNN